MNPDNAFTIMKKLEYDVANPMAQAMAYLLDAQLYREYRAWYDKDATAPPIYYEFLKHRNKE